MHRLVRSGPRPPEPLFRHVQCLGSDCLMKEKDVPIVLWLAVAIILFDVLFVAVRLRAARNVANTYRAARPRGRGLRSPH